jgi:DNA-binding response OmpR family regulator
LRGARILVVDDERLSVEMLGRYLSAKGHRVSGAGSAEEAAGLLRAGDFDLILLDVVLPGATGLQALAVLRRLSRAPIHMMSGNSDDDARHDARLLGASGFFGKPLDLGAVTALIDGLPA